jgi:hypothetical protein
LQAEEMNKEWSKVGVRMVVTMVGFANQRSKYIKFVSHDAKRATTCDLRLLKCMCEPYLLRQVHCYPFHSYETRPLYDRQLHTKGIQKGWFNIFSPDEGLSCSCRAIWLISVQKLCPLWFVLSKPT